MIRVLRNRTYRHLFLAQVVALLGTGLLTVALSLLAYDLAGSHAGAVVGTALAIKMIAYVGVAPVIATVAERLPRKTLMVGSDLLRASIALMLPFVDHVWQIYLLIFLLQAASAAFTPAFQSVIPAVLPGEEDYTQALSMSRLAYDLESLVSPVFAAALLWVMTYHSLFVGTALGFLGSAALVVSATLPQLVEAERTGSFGRRLTSGMRVFGSSAALRSLLAMNMVVAAATALVLVNTVVYVRDEFERSTTDVAVAYAAFGAGSMAVALALPKLLRLWRDRSLMFAGCAVVPPTMFAALAVTPADSGWLLLLVLWLVLGAGTSLILTPSARVLRRNSQESNRAAVFAAEFSLSHACFILSYPIAGWLGSASGLRSASLALAIVASVASGLAVFLWRQPLRDPTLNGRASA